tara:strand:- start:1048 stop:1359 length:312 start_codon:yes stop_codon:yes gene_type:complete
MADRYLRIKRKIDRETKNRVYESTLYPQINPNNSDIVTIVKVGAQRLDILSYRYYGTPDLWWVISQANNLGGDTMVVPAGTKIRIPQDIETILRDMDNLNNKR